MAIQDRHRDEDRLRSAITEFLLRTGKPVPGDLDVHDFTRAAAPLIEGANVNRAMRHRLVLLALVLGAAVFVIGVAAIPLQTQFDNDEPCGTVLRPTGRMFGADDCFDVLPRHRTVSLIGGIAVAGLAVVPLVHRRFSRRTAIVYLVAVFVVASASVFATASVEQPAPVDVLVGSNPG